MLSRFQKSSRSARSTPTPRRPQKWTRTLLGVELLESREMLDASSVLVVDSLYRDLLDRPADEGGKIYWAGLLDAGVGREVVIDSLLRSNEYLDTQTRRTFRELTGTEVPTNELAFLRTELNTFGQLSLEAAVATSSTYRNLKGVTADQYVTSLYTDFLGRTPDGGGKAYWVARMPDGLDRRQATDDFLGSTESIRRHASLLYPRLLDRSADEGGLNFWVNTVVSTRRIESIISGLLASNEYFNLKASSGGGSPSDTTKPVVTIESPVSGTRSAANITVVGTATDAGSGLALLQASVDAGGFLDVAVNAQGRFTFTTSLATGGTADGAHTVRLRALDKAGNISDIKEVTFTLDSVAPRAIPSVAGIISTSVSTLTITYTEPIQRPTGGVLYTLTPTGGIAITPASVVTIDDQTDRINLSNPLPDGEYTLNVGVGVTDRTGNALGSPTSFVFRVDTLAPGVTVDTPLPGQLVNGTLAVAGQIVDNGSGVASLQAATDGGAFGEVSVGTNGRFRFIPPLFLGGLNDGPHTVRLRATDQAGNTSDLREVAFTFDSVAPSAASTASGSVPRGTASFVVAFSEDVGSAAFDALRYEVKSVGGAALDGLSAARIDDSSVRLTLASAPADGDYTLSIKPGVTDAAGNPLTGSRVFTFRVVPPSGGGGGGGDQTPPTVTITAPAAGALVRTNPTVSGTATDASGIALLLASVDGGAFVEVAVDAQGAFSFPTTLPLGGSADGTHTVRLRAFDTTGNVSAVQQVGFTLDSVAPTATSSASGTLSTNPSSITVTYSEAVSDAFDDLSTYTLRLGTNTVAPSSLDRFSDRSVRLNFTTPLADGSYTLTIASTVTDAAGNPATPSSFAFQIVTPVAIDELSPANGEEMVSLTRETVVRFSDEVDSATVLRPDAFYLIANGQRLPGHLRVSGTNRFATFFYDNPLPASTEVRVVVDGEKIVGKDGLRLDADGDGVPGGLATADFRTLPVTQIPGTTVFGYVFDSYNRNADGQVITVHKDGFPDATIDSHNIPVVGATITLDALPGVSAVTDATGRFELFNVPAPEFFVHIDGTTAAGAPTGTKYPRLGKPFHSVPGQVVQLNMASTPFDIFLPPMAMTGDNITTLRTESNTDVVFGTAAKAQIDAMFPDAATAQLVKDTMKVTYPAGSAQDANGTKATVATVIPVDPQRLPAPLPPGATPKLVVSIQAGTTDENGIPVFNQAGGTAEFDTPAPVTFPNLEGFTKDDRIAILSFNHDAGMWEAVATAHLSDDKKTIISDPGQGILAPGWHYTGPPAISPPPPSQGPRCDASSESNLGKDGINAMTTQAGANTAASISFPDQKSCEDYWKLLYQKLKVDVDTKWKSCREEQDKIINDPNAGDPAKAVAMALKAQCYVEYEVKLSELASDLKNRLFDCKCQIQALAAYIPLKAMWHLNRIILPSQIYLIVSSRHHVAIKSA